MKDFVDGTAFNAEQGNRARKLFAAVVLAALDDAIADDMVSETLARIFVAQDRSDEAIEVYETLAEREPERRSAWLTEAETLRQRYNRPADDA